MSFYYSPFTGPFANFPVQDNVIVEEPDLDNETDIGSATKRYKTVHAVSIHTDDLRCKTVGVLAPATEVKLVSPVDANGYDITGVGSVESQQINSTDMQCATLGALAPATEVKLTTDIDADSNDIKQCGTVTATNVDATNVACDALAGTATTCATLGALAPATEVKLTTDIDADGNDIKQCGTMTATSVDATNVICDALACGTLGSGSGDIILVSDVDADGHSVNSAGTLNADSVNVNTQLVSAVIRCDTFGPEDSEVTLSGPINAGGYNITNTNAVYLKDTHPAVGCRYSMYGPITLSATTAEVSMLVGASVGSLVFAPTQPLGMTLRFRVSMVANATLGVGLWLRLKLNGTQVVLHQPTFAGGLNDEVITQEVIAVIRSGTEMRMTSTYTLNGEAPAINTQLVTYDRTATNTWSYTCQMDAAGPNNITVVGFHIETYFNV